MEHWYLYAKDKKNISKIIFRIWGKFMAFIIQIFVDPQEAHKYYNNNMNKEPNKYTRKIDSSNNFFFRDPYIPISETWY